MERQGRTADAAIAARAARAHGVVSRSGLLAAGLEPGEIRVRCERGSLIEVHRGVYRVGHTAPSVDATYLAAVLACGSGALLGGLAACWLLGLVGGDAPAPLVWAPTERRVPGVVCRRCRRSDPRRGRKLVRGIPTVGAARGLVDAAASLSLAELAKASHVAGIKYRTTPRQVAAVMLPTVRGARNLRLIIGREVQVELSKLESRFGRLLRAEGMPRPQTNRVATGRRVDCRWPEHRLTVELDSFTFHNSRHSWEQDRRREREAYARGDHFRRYTWGDVFEDPVLMLTELRELLS